MTDTKIYRVEADYVRPNSDVIGTGAYCYTREDAEQLAKEWRERPEGLTGPWTNIRITERDLKA